MAGQNYPALDQSIVLVLLCHVRPLLTRQCIGVRCIISIVSVIGAVSACIRCGHTAASRENCPVLDGCWPEPATVDHRAVERCVVKPHCVSPIGVVLKRNDKVCLKRRNRAEFCPYFSLNWQMHNTKF